MGGDRFDSIMAFIEGNVLEAGVGSPATRDPGWLVHGERGESRWVWISTLL